MYDSPIMGLVAIDRNPGFINYIFYKSVILNHFNLSILFIFRLGKSAEYALSFYQFHIYPIPVSVKPITQTMRKFKRFKTYIDSSIKFNWQQNHLMESSPNNGRNML